MSLKTQLYIDVSDNTIDEEAKYELVEFFDFESIEITETIKNIQEVDVVFTDYTKEFVVPASKGNNKIFSHYYSTSLLNSFDARIKKRARLFVNGIFFKQGYVRLSSAQIKDGYPYSYSLTFFGALSGLNDVIGETKLADLDYLNRYDHEFNLSNVSSGLKKGLQYNGSSMVEYTNISRDVVYPLISAQNQWFYDSEQATAPSEFQEGKGVNIYKEVINLPYAGYGIDYKQLKPAIKVSHIFKAIEEKFDSINIKPTSFIYSSKVDDLYLLLHNRKGSLSQGIGDAEVFSKTFVVKAGDGFSDFNASGADQELLPIVTYTRYEAGSINSFYQSRSRTEVSFNVNITAPIAGELEYTMEILNGTTVLTSKTVTSLGSNGIAYNLESVNQKTWDIRFRISSSGSVIEYEVDMVINEFYGTRFYYASISDGPWSENYKTHTYPSVELSYTSPQRVEIFRQIPDMKVIDFMKGIFKLFNLVVKVDDMTGELEILTLNDYYISGTERDITNYVDTFNYDIERLQLYGEINFKYQEPKTFGVLNHNEINQDEFGDLSYNTIDEGTNNNFIFDKGKYEVKLPFEKLYYSRLRDENEIVTFKPLTNICTGWLVGEDQEPVVPKPVLFFNVNTNVDDTLYKFGLLNETEYITTYNRASNSNKSGSLTLNFGSEVDEYVLEENENSLFNNYYRPYVLNTFNRESRNLKLKGKLPLSFLFEYSLADKLIINGAPYIINEITTNLNTGKSQLDLITAFKIDLDEFIDTTPPADVTGLAVESVSVGGFRIIWEGNIESDLQGYKVYLKKSTDANYTLNTTLGVQNNLAFRDLEQGVAYDVKITAYDEAGNESSLASATSIQQTTGSASDTTPPTIPTNLRKIFVGSNDFTISWDASTDDAGVALYNIYLEGVAYGTETSTTTTVSGLNADSFYNVSIDAEDTSGNKSRKTTAIRIKTLPQ